MSLGEHLILYVLNHINKRCRDELELLGRELRIPQIPFDRIRYADARDAGDFKRECKEPFWIVDFPIEEREFYDKEDPKRPRILRDMDLVYPEGYGEAGSGGERENTYNRALARIKMSGLNPIDFGPYLAILKEGLPSSAGFGMGVERLTRFICGLKRIEETTLFSKVPGSFNL
jgi:asparaginyl-tRNA synthetase